MGVPYSLDLRERVVSAVASGMSRRGAAKLYQVSYAAVIRWVSRSKQTGSAAALPMGGKKPFKLAADSDLSAHAFQREAAH
jgi:transposase